MQIKCGGGLVSYVVCCVSDETFFAFTLFPDLMICGFVCKNKVWATNLKFEEL